MKKITDNVLGIIRHMNIKTLVALPVFIGLILFISLLLLGDRIFNGTMPDIYLASIGIIAAFVFSLSGIFQIYRREAPGLLGETVKGRVPVWIGSMWVAFTWTLGLFLLYQVILELSKNLSL